MRLLDVLRTQRHGGIVTTSYPDVPESAPPAYRGQIQLHVERCTSDGACARACPSQAISVTITDTRTWQLDDARCVFCGLCAEACPTGAILISNEFELAVRQRSQLATRVTIESSALAQAGERAVK